jgi:hypothetical protein
MADKLISQLEEGIPGSSDFILYDPSGSGYYKKAQAGNLPGGGGGGAVTLSTPTLTATAASSSQINLSWTNVSNESSYKLEWSANGSTGWTQIGGTIAANTTTYNHTGLTSSTAYYYRVSAIGNGTTYLTSGFGTANATTAAPGATQLSTPGSFAASVISSTQINLSWTDVANESSYMLEWSPNGSSGWTQIGGTIAAGSTSYNHTGLTASTLYYYRLKAVGNGTTYTDSNYATANATTSSGASYDTDAQAFFTAAGITDTTQKDAVDALVVALKAASIWAKMDAIYPMVGGDSTKHSYNLKAPGSYQLTYTGGLTHNANGITGNGSTGYIDTNYIPSSQLADTSSCSFVAYNRTNANGIVLYTYQSGEGSVDLQRFSDGNVYAAYGKDQGNRVSTALADASGRFIVSRESSTSLKLYRNGSQLGSTVTANDAANAVSDSVKLLCEWGGTSASNFQSYNIAFFALGDGLNGTEAAAFDSALATFNTALSR